MSLRYIEGSIDMEYGDEPDGRVFSNYVFSYINARTHSYRRRNWMPGRDHYPLTRASDRTSGIPIGTARRPSSMIFSARAANKTQVNRRIFRTFRCPISSSIGPVMRKPLSGRK